MNRSLSYSRYALALAFSNCWPSTRFHISYLDISWLFLQEQCLRGGGLTLDGETEILQITEHTLTFRSIPGSYKIIQIIQVSSGCAMHICFPGTHSWFLYERHRTHWRVKAEKILTHERKGVSFLSLLKEQRSSDFWITWLHQCFGYKYALDSSVF